MKILNNIKVGLLAVLALTACSEWDDHYQDSLTSGSGETLWQTLQQNPELSDFCDVLQKTMVTRQYRPTAVSYAELLQGGQALTVLAPKNGTYNKDSILALLETPKGDSIVEKKFVLNHILRSSASCSPEMKEVRLANGKRIMMGEGRIGNVNIETPNIPTHNGVMHILETAMPYGTNLYEAMCDMPQFASIGEQIRKYSRYEFDENSSLLSGMVDGMKVYVDSVIYEQNKMFNAIGQLSAEDSTYYMTVPTAAGWAKAWDKVSKYFVYDPAILKADSMQHYWTTRALLDDVIYSPSVQKSMKDSLVSGAYSRRYPGDGHVYYKPFEANGLMGSAENMIQCSNGYIYPKDDYPLSPEQTFFRKIRVEGENFDRYAVGYDKTNVKVNHCRCDARWISADSISGSGYMVIVPEDPLSPQWNFTMKVPNTLAGKYDICLITLPMSVYKKPTEDDPAMGTKFKAYIQTYDEKGVQTDNYECNTISASGKEVKYFVNNAERVDTVVLAKGYEFKTCNYDLENQKVRVRLESNIKTTADKRNYKGEMFIDCIYLRPSEAALKED